MVLWLTYFASPTCNLNYQWPPQQQSMEATFTFILPSWTVTTHHKFPSPTTVVTLVVATTIVSNTKFSLCQTLNNMVQTHSGLHHHLHTIKIFLVSLYPFSFFITPFLLHCFSATLIHLSDPNHDNHFHYCITTTARWKCPKSLYLFPTTIDTVH